MAREQFGICAEPSLHGYYLLFNVLDDKNAYVRHVLSRLPALFDKYADRFSESNLTGVVKASTKKTESGLLNLKTLVLSNKPLIEDNKIICGYLNIALILFLKSSDGMDY